MLSLVFVQCQVELCKLLSDFKRFDFQDIVLSVSRHFRHLSHLGASADYQLHCRLNAFSSQDKHEPIASRFRMELIGFPGYPHTVSAGLSESSPLRPDFGVQLKEQTSKIGSSFRGSPCSSCCRTLMEYNQNFCYLCARGLSPACVCYLVGGSVSQCPQGYRLVESARLPVEFLPSSGH